MKLIKIIALTFVMAHAAAGELRVGIIGCDTSHVVAFTESLNDPTSTNHLSGGRVVAAFKGGSKDLARSTNRVDKYAATMQEKYGVKFYATIGEVCQQVDAICLESVDGRVHLEQAREIFKSGKPVFIDKPLAPSVAEAAEIFRMAEAAQVKVFSSSSLRFAANTQAVRQGLIGKVLSMDTWGSCEREPTVPDLFFYGLHQVEALYTVLGTNCESVQWITTTNGKIEVAGTWDGGRKGVLHEDKSFHGVAKGEQGESPAGSFDGYVPLLKQIMKFFETGVAPVKPAETLEVIAFMEAASQSKANGGAPVKISAVLASARP
jgi:hypothetical protein